MVKRRESWESDTVRKGFVNSVSGEGRVVWGLWDVAVFVWVVCVMVIVIAERGCEVEAASRAYEPRGAALELFYQRGDEVVLSGPAGTGKSRAGLEKLHLLAVKYAGSRHLVVRKTRESLTESGLVTFEEKVLPEGSGLRRGPSRRLRQRYEYPNGSELIIGGLDKASRVMSTEFDVVFVQEATELTEGEWEALTTRLRNGRMPYQQIVADCNPGPPSHWLKQRANRGDLALLESRHEDNPVLWDAERGEWTEVGVTYLGRLDRLTGVRKQRLRYGLWAAAEGMVYAGVWAVAHNLVERSVIPAEWPRYWVIDFGYTNPFVWQAWAEDEDGRLIRYREIYQTRRLVEDHAREILRVTRDEPKPEIVICDHDAEDRATFERHTGLSTWAAKKAIKEGIEAVASRMARAEDGRARLLLMRGSLVSRDESLVEEHRPTCTEEEIEGYVWNEAKDMPVKREDHGCDAMRYVVAWRDLGRSEGIYF